MRALFLNPPSFQGFDGGAGARYQARREIRSFWYPTWLAQAAALVPESKLIDAPADGLSPQTVIKAAASFDLVVIFTSTPSFANDTALAAAIRHQSPAALIGLVGPHVSVLPDESLREAPAVDFVVRREFDVPISRIAAGESLAQIAGVSWRDGQAIRHNPDAEILTDLDSLPFVVDVYRRDLTIEHYYIGYLMHPYLSIHTGRGCPGRCIYCLWPQTMSGHTYRTRSPESVYRELALAGDYFPQVKEYFIDDDTFTADPNRAEAIAELIKTLGITWSTSSRANVSYDTLRKLRECRLRLLMVGFESGSDDILRRARKGTTTEMARKFMGDCKSLGIAVHGTFMLGLPGETPDTIEQTISFARELDPETVQVSIAAPYPGTAFHREAFENAWLVPDKLVDRDGTQSCPLQYETLTGTEIENAVRRFYRRFYFRPHVLVRMAGEMARGGAEVRRRRIREGGEFLAFLNHRGTDRQGLLGLARRVLRDGGPGFCQFAITDACNARCAFCNFAASTTRANRRTFVETDAARAALDVLAAKGVGYLVLTGGEPMLHPNLTRIAAHAARLNMAPILCTNGWLLGEEMIARLVDAGLCSAIISVDAADAEMHDANRKLPGLCTRIAAANRSLRSHGIASTASVTISRLVGDLSRLAEFLNSLGFERVTFSYPIRSLGSSFLGFSESELIDYSPEELVDIFDQIRKLKRRFRVANPTASLADMRRLITGERQQFACLAGYKYFYLDWKLDLYRCQMWPTPACSVFEFDRSKLVRDGCQRCMLDCYRDGSVLHHVGVALHDAAADLASLRPIRAARRLLCRTTLDSVRAVSEEREWLSSLRRKS